MKKKYQPRLNKVYYCMSDGSTFSLYETGGAHRLNALDLSSLKKTNKKNFYKNLDKDTKNHHLWSKRKI